MVNPFIYLISTIISLVNILLIVWIVLGWLIALKIVNPYQPFVEKLNHALSRLFDPILRPIRKYLPDMGGVDLSPIVLILFLNFVDYALRYYF